MFYENWWYFLQTVSISQSCRPVCLCPHHGGMRKAGTEAIEPGWVWCPILVPSLAIYFIPVSPGFHSIIINKITMEAYPWICAYVGHCLHTGKVPGSGPNTQALSSVTVILLWGKEQKESSIPIPFSVFPPQLLSMKIFISYNGCQLPYHINCQERHGFY